MGPGSGAVALLMWCLEKSSKLCHWQTAISLIVGFHVRCITSTKSRTYCRCIHLTAERGIMVLVSEKYQLSLKFIQLMKINSIYCSKRWVWSISWCFLFLVGKQTRKHGGCMEVPRGFAQQELWAGCRDGLALDSSCAQPLDSLCSYILNGSANSC